MRLSVSVPDELGEAVQNRATHERRGLSNMVALLLELGLAVGGTSLPSTAGTMTSGDSKTFRGPDPKVKK